MIEYLICFMSEQFHRRWININDPQFLLGVFARLLNRNPNRVEFNAIQRNITLKLLHNIL